MVTFSSVTSTEINNVTPDDDSNEPTFPYGLGVQQSIVPPSLTDLNLPPNNFNTLATMAVVQGKSTQHDNNYSPMSPELSEPAPISTPPMSFGTIDGWETLHTINDDNAFYSEDELQQVH